MPKLETTYEVAKFGYATSFTESEQPPTFALKFRNRFINSAGGAEKRQGMTLRGSIIPGTPNITNLHEYVDTSGSSTLFASGAGNIYKEASDGTWSSVYTGNNTTAKMRSVQFGKKLIFVNGVDRNIFTEDGTNFQRLRAIVVRGETAVTASATRLDDANVDSWLVDTNVANNDLVFNHTTGGAAIVTDVVSGHVTHDAITSAGGGTGLGGIGTVSQQSGDRYTVYDMVELNIIPTSDEPDNTATLGPGSNATTVAVSGVNFLTTDIRAGDYVHNTTIGAVALVSSVATALTVTSVASQTAGDAAVFLTEAMPVASNAHVHFGRLYLVDSTDESKIRISGPNDAQDFSTETGTLDSTSFAFGELQPDGEIVKDMASFQRFFGVGGKQNLFLYDGTDPIADTSGATTTFNIIGLFPQGIVSPDALLSIGNDLAFVTPDGVQTASLVGDASTLGRANISEAIKTSLREKIKDAAESDIQTVHYPRRSWYMLKIGSEFFVFNYSPFFGTDRLADQSRVSQQAGATLGPNRGSWSLFDGKFARQNAYLVLQDGSMVVAGAGGRVYNFDDGSYTDDGEVYTTEYQTSWLILTEPRDNIKIKQGNYIKPIFDVGAAISYTITAEGDFDVSSRDTITVTVSGASEPIGLATIPAKIGGSSVQNKKYSLRWRGEQVRVTFKTNDAQGPDVLSQFTLYANMFGTR